MENNWIQRKSAVVFIIYFCDLFIFLYLVSSLFLILANAFFKHKKSVFLKLLYKKMKRELSKTSQEHILNIVSVTFMIFLMPLYEYILNNKKFL